MVIVELPVGVVAEVVIVIVEVQVGLQLAELNEAIAPEGRPDAEKLTDWLVPDVRPAVTVVVMLLPPIIAPLVGLADKEKSNTDDTQLPDEQVPEEQYVPVADCD